MKAKKTLDEAIKVCDSNITKSDVQKIYSLLSSALQNSANPNKMLQYIDKAQSAVLMLMTKL